MLKIYTKIWETDRDFFILVGFYYGIERKKEVETGVVENSRYLSEERK